VVLGQLTPASGPLPAGAIRLTHVAPPSDVETITVVSKFASDPTATHAVALVQLTPASGPADAGAFWLLQVLPPSELATICAPVKLAEVPTEMQAVAVGHDTELRTPTGTEKDALTCHPEDAAPASVVASMPAPMAITEAASNWPMTRYRGSRLIGGAPKVA
jgi:hypothetical protein